MKHNHMYLLTILLFLASLPCSLISRVRTPGPRLWNLAQETVEQEADFLIKITNIPLPPPPSGVYRLAESLTIGGGATGITITANDVTIDLNGKKISGGATGISISASQNN